MTRGPAKQTPHGSRRDLLVGGAASVGLLAGSSAAIASRADTCIAQGYVFEDIGMRGTRTASTPGIPRVMVSNGRDVVLTDTAGFWRLPVDEGDMIFVVKPPHWEAPTVSSIPAISYH